MSGIGGWNILDQELSDSELTGFDAFYDAFRQFVAATFVMMRAVALHERPFGAPLTMLRATADLSIGTNEPILRLA